MPGPLLAGAVAGAAMDGVDALVAVNLRSKFYLYRQRRRLAACNRELRKVGVYGLLPLPADDQLTTSEQFVGLGLFMLEKLKIPVRVE